MKGISIFFLAILFMGLLSISCNDKEVSKEIINDKTSTFDLIATKKIIQEKTNKFTKAHITRGTIFLNNSFSQDAKVFPPNSDAVIGHSAISALNSAWVSYGIYEFKEESTSFYGNDDYLIDEGTYYLRYGEENTIDNGKYINIWKKENADWKIFSNIWNTSIPIANPE